ncbi:hypothetical protein Y032_0073g735 [Ancylostoma ceylanicum]|nr:hypothetical protein Y032_0073g735 [Ancylostoma ceylanicum]
MFWGLNDSPSSSPQVAPPKASALSVVPSWIPDCLVIGDLFNYGHDEDAYEQEGELIDAVAYELFESTSLSSLGLWAFGYTSFSKRPSGSLEKMRKNYDDFQSDLVDFDYVNISDPLDIKAAIDAINAMRDNGGRINCLVLFSPLKDTTGVPSIEPVPIGVEKVVGVGLNNVNLEALLPGNGLAVKVPRNFLDEHVSAVVNAIISRPQPITTRITTTEPSFARRDCIFVGDLFNYGNDTDSYDQEMNFISDLVYDFLDPWYYKTTAGFWAYGYTNFSKSANTSLETMTKNYYKFNEELLKMEYFNTTDPWTTKEAIEELNRMYVSGRRANCIVFFSAQKNTTGLPQINPKNMDHADRVIAVGIDTDLRGIVPYYGQAVRIPLYYRNDYVYRVLTAIMEQPPPTQPPKPTLVPISTEQTPTSTQTTSAEPTGTTTAGPRKSDIHCVLAGDMLNIRDRDTYDREAYFMKKIGARLFETTSRFIAGVWSYGYSRLYEMWLVYDTMTDNYMAFSADVNAKMYSYAGESAKITTDNG